MTINRRLKLNFLASFCLCLAHTSLAQSVSLIANEGYAQLCYEASTMAARSEVASFKDLQTCTNAIDYELLLRKDLIATYTNRGVIYAALERFDSARADYEKAMSMDASLPATYLNRGNLFFLSREFSRAIEDYNKSMELELDQRHVALVNRGLAHEYSGNLTQAKRDYEASLLARPNWAEATSRLERVERKLAQ